MVSSRVLGLVLVAAVMTACGGPSEQAGPAGAAGSSAAVTAPPVTPATVQRVTPILAVESIEPVMPFWEGLGFTPVSPTWVDDTLVFVAFAKDGLEVHYQTRAHIEGNIPAATEALADTTSLVYVTVDNLDLILAGLGDAEVVIPRRRTSWGSDEIYVREPGGNIIAFAAFGR